MVCSGCLENNVYKDAVKETLHRVKNPFLVLCRTPLFATIKPPSTQLDHDCRRAARYSYGLTNDVTRTGAGRRDCSQCSILEKSAQADAEGASGQPP